MNEKPTTIRDLIQVATTWLTGQGVEEARLDTELLLSHVLGLRRLDLYLDHDRPLVAVELASFRGLMRRRGEAREPVAYLLGRRGFFGLDLQAAPGALIPRPDTELLVELGAEFLKSLEDGSSRRFADVGTGSGCVGLALATEVPLARGLAIDRSPAALSVARRNCAELELEPRVQLVLGDLLSPCARNSLDLVLSNPPYVLESERALLSPEILRHEPAAALFDGEGLPLSARLVAQARRVLRPGGLLAVETGFDKAPLVESFFLAEGFVKVRRVEDLGGIERVVVGEAPGPAEG